MRRNIDPRAINLSRGQVVELLSGQCNVRNLRPGDTIQWSCGYIDPWTHARCDYRVQETVEEETGARDWPDWMIDHIWQNGHYTMDTSNGAPPFYHYQPESESQHVPYVLIGMAAFIVGLVAGAWFW